MASYSDFAYVYDTFMDQVPYEKWHKDIVRILKEHKIDDGLILDLACGTGVMTRALRDSGYDMIGVDISEEMLDVAREAEYASLEYADDWDEPDVSTNEDDEPSILYLNQDMTEFELYGTVRAIVCLCDSINYLTDEAEVEKCLKLVNNYLDPDGIFIMDFNTPEKYAAIGDSVIAENREDCSFIWENFYDASAQINVYELTLFIEEEDGLYRRSEETHVQRGYSEEEMRGLIDRSGLILLDMQKQEDGRVLAICQERGKNE